MDAVVAAPLKRRNYVRDEFLPETRSEDLKSVEDVIAAVEQKKTDQPRTIILRHEVGSGKTWFVHYLKQVLAKNPRVKTLLISFSPALDQTHAETDEYHVPPDLSAPSAKAETLAQNLLEWIAKQIDPHGAPNADLAEQTTWLRNKVEQEFTKRTLVLIFDSLFEVDWDKMPRLERALLAPLAAIPRVVLILTGRGRIYAWESPLLRVSVVRAIPKPLRPFDEAEIQEQLKRQCEVPPKLSAKTILALGGGYPWVNYLLAHGADERAATRLAADELTRVIPEALRQAVRRDLEALSVLEGFGEDEMKILWSAYDPDAPELSRPEVRKRRDQILGAFLMHWRDGRFVIDKPMRLILENYLKYNEPKKWQRLHCRAKKLYRDWASRYQDHAETFTRRADYHNEQLASAERNRIMKITECEIEPAAQRIAHNAAKQDVSASNTSMLAMGMPEGAGVMAE